MATSGTTTPPLNLAQAVNGVFQAANNIFRLAEQLVYVANDIEDEEQKTKILRVATDLAEEAKNVIRGQDSVVNAFGRTRSW